MRVALISLMFWATAAFATHAQTSDLQELATGNDARGWEAVGRLDIYGKGFCTGSLIAPDIVLTAAHCLYVERTGAAVLAADIEFLAGLRNGRPEATRRASSYLVHPAYVHSDGETTQRLRHDVALIVLDRPIRSAEIEALDVSQTASNGTQIGVVSYAEGRQNAPSMQDVCNVLGEQDGLLVMDCAVDFGASGSPVFRYENGVPRLVSVVSAMAEIDGQNVSLGPDLAQPLPLLLELVKDTPVVDGLPQQDRPTGARVIRPGERADTGALFVRP